MIGKSTCSVLDLIGRHVPLSSASQTRAALEGADMRKDTDVHNPQVKLTTAILVAATITLTMSATDSLPYSFVNWVNCRKIKALNPMSAQPLPSRQPAPAKDRLRLSLATTIQKRLPSSRSASAKRRRKESKHLKEVMPSLLPKLPLWQPLFIRLHATTAVLLLPRPRPILQTPATTISILLPRPSRQPRHSCLPRLQPLPRPIPL